MQLGLGMQSGQSFVILSSRTLTPSMVIVWLRNMMKECFPSLFLLEQAMTPLRQRMVEDLKLRNLSPNTQNAYVRAVANLAQHYRKSPDLLDRDEVRAYLVHLAEKRVSPSLFNQVRCALQFFYRITLGRDWVLNGIVCARLRSRCRWSQPR